MAAYTLRYTVDGEFDETVESVVSALDDEGFGVLCDIDVRATMREKLDEEFRNYRILGACNPPLAHRAMRTDLELGALLPCNVIVYDLRGPTGELDGDVARERGRVGVSAVDPAELLSVVDDPELDAVADEVTARLQAAIESLPGATRVESGASD